MFFFKKKHAPDTNSDIFHSFSGLQKMDVTYTRVVCAKIVVIGDAEAGKTTLCKSLQKAWPVQSLSASEMDEKARPTAPSFCEEYYFAQVEDGPVDSHTDTCDDVTGVTLQLIDQSGCDRESLQPIIFRKACGAYVVLDGMHFFAEYICDLDAAEGRSKSCLRLRSSTPFRATGQQVSPKAGEDEQYSWWQYAQDNVMHWAHACYRECAYVRENEGLQLPLIVVVTRCDLLPTQYAPFVTNFIAELKSRLKGPAVGADDVLFVAQSRSAVFPPSEISSFEAVGLKLTALLRERMLPLLRKHGEADTILLRPKPNQRAKNKKKCEC